MKRQMAPEMFASKNRLPEASHRKLGPVSLDIAGPGGTYLADLVGDIDSGSVIEYRNFLVKVLVQDVGRGLDTGLLRRGGEAVVVVVLATMAAVDRLP